MGLFNKKVHPTRKKVNEWAEELELIKMDSDESFVGMQGSAVVKAMVFEEDETKGLVLLSCPVLQGVPNKPGVLEELFFGVGNEKPGLFFWDVRKHEDGTLTIFLELTLMDIHGSLDKDEFGVGIAMLANAADEIDDKLQKKVGGSRGEDALNDAKK